MLSIYLQNESQRWAAQHQTYPASASASASAFPSSNDSSALSDYDEESDCESIFSRTSNRSRRSSVSSILSDEEEAAPVPFDQPRDFNGAPITMFASLDQAVAQSTQRVETQGAPRRLVTPGKLYENEEEDDEIMEMEAEDQQMDYHTTTTTRSVEGGFHRIVATCTVAVG
ncbi:uncharacterized protein F4822DRAFT_214425 [Hypoxylon trugodes]|uniref:uncharacterized protein n=1 Tax=Hypoxylon trugodes TaxID=326681 RepID=UPI00219F5CCC|nr:uncharacterized protein F4822DRAFT_214425 [Hypoxylon trugodes]KAI1389806.1 hypothetical protein F4822DRAFT_214425 [Hypoxylon trugodes]